MFHYGFAQCHHCPKTQHPPLFRPIRGLLHRPQIAGFQVLFTGSQESADLVSILNWNFLSWGHLIPTLRAFSQFPDQCPTLPLALEPKRISGSSSFKVQWEEDSGTLWFISAGNQVLWASTAPLRRHQSDIYSGSSWDLRQDLQEMIAGGHVVRLKLYRNLNPKGHKNVEESANRNIAKHKTGPHPFAKHGLHGPDQQLPHCPALVATGSVSFRV